MKQCAQCGLCGGCDLRTAWLKASSKICFLSVQDPDLAIVRIKQKERGPHTTHKSMASSISRRKLNDHTSTCAKTATPKSRLFQRLKRYEGTSKTLRLRPQKTRFGGSEISGFLVGFSEGAKPCTCDGDITDPSLNLDLLSSQSGSDVQQTVIVTQASCRCVS